MSDLVAFLRARLDEDERAAHEHGGPFHMICCTPPQSAGRVLRDVEAKRRIVSRYERFRDGRNGTGSRLDRTVAPQTAVAMEPALRDLASAWSDHPDYDPAWA